MDGKQIVLSGIRATGRLHLGNYMGAVRQFVEAGENPDTFGMFFIADLHSLTTASDRGLIVPHRNEIVLDYLAAGIDVDGGNSIIYAQSDVPGIPKLAWMLSCITPTGDLLGMPGYQDKRATITNAGFLYYPVLMAADILGPKADIVPVGDDQRPHIDLARELARRFNNEVAKCEFFPVPEGRTNLTVPGLGLMNPDGSFPKMSKSEEGGIGLMDSPAEIRGKIRVAPTDPERKLRTDPGTPQRCAIFALHGFFSSDEEVREVATGCSTAGIGCVDCKGLLAKNIIHTLEPFQERRRALSLQPGLAEDVLDEGADRARSIIEPTVEEVSSLMGL